MLYGFKLHIRLLEDLSEFIPHDDMICDIFKRFFYDTCVYSKYSVIYADLISKVHNG